MNGNRKRLAILVGGGPAPGINSVISSVTIEARNEGLDVIGILDGFEQLSRATTDMVRALTIEDVSRIHFQRRLDPAHVAHQPDQGDPRPRQRGRRRAAQARRRATW